MTVQELFVNTLHILHDSENARFDATCLVEDLAGVPRGSLESRKELSVDDSTAQTVLHAAKRRADGYPLQYLLGNWDFLDLTLSVGEGVLIPRPETELLCETTAAAIERFPQKQHPIRVFDLCAGSGCVGLGVSSLVHTHHLQVTEVEFSDFAMVYLKENVQRYPQFCVNTVKADVLADFDRFDDKVDVIVSNPPYIKTNDLSGLQREVQYEPTMALDGSEDGLRFYRAIANHWVPKLNDGGFIAVEIGIDQLDDVIALFKAANLKDVTAINDYANIPRVITGHK